ncbi:MAG: homocysteine S-methyltransferase [Cyclobacteriaceae bacterium]
MRHQLQKLIKNGPIVIDGGLSNVLESEGCDLNHPLWTAKLLDENPEVLVSAHLSYLRAGVHLITTSSYQASFPGLRRSGFNKDQAKQLMLKSVELASEAVDRFMEEMPSKSRPMIAASAGPYGAFLADGSEYQGNYGVSDQVLYDFHTERLEVLCNTEADILACETIPSFQEAKVLSKLLNEVRKPAWVSFSCKDAQHISDGTAIGKVAAIFVGHPSVFAVGINCTHPSYISNLILEIKKILPDKWIVAYPNSGEVFDADTKTWSDFSDPQLFIKKSREWIESGVSLIGGCCRIGPEQIEQLTKLYL